MKTGIGFGKPRASIRARAVERGRENKDRFLQAISPEKMASDQQGPWISKSTRAPVEKIAEPVP
jgi:hypothetical protein